MKKVVSFLIIGAILALVHDVESEKSKKSSCKVFKEPDQPLGCPKCAFEVAPVCGWNGKCFQWFLNSCLLLSNNCYTEETRFMECEDCKCSQCCQDFSMYV